MRRFLIAESAADFTSHAGLGLIGMALKRHADMVSDTAAASPLRSDAIAHRDILACYVALLCLGKSAFEAITGFREDAFFQAALGLERVTSEGTPRQRMDAHAQAYRMAMVEASLAFLRQVGAPVTPSANGLVPLDADATQFDNSGTHKQGVSLTYKGHHGFTPMAAYLGREGWSLEPELREGKQHPQSGTPALLERLPPRARELTERPLLLRLDSGYDAIENIAVIEVHSEHHCDGAPAQYIIKWNPRQESPEQSLAPAEWEQPRPGKRVAVFEVRFTRTHSGDKYPLRRVVRMIERTIDKHGQQLLVPVLVPEIALEGWWTSLWRQCAEIIALCADNATPESGFKQIKQETGSAKNQTRTAHAVSNPLNFCLMATTPTWICADRLQQAPERRHQIRGRSAFAFSDVRRPLAEAALHPNFQALCPPPKQSPHNPFVRLLLRMVALSMTAANATKFQQTSAHVSCVAITRKKPTIRSGALDDRRRAAVAAHPSH